MGTRGVPCLHHFGASMPTMERPATLETSTGSLNRATKSVESRSQACPAKPVQACHTEFTSWSPDSTGRMPWKPAEVLYEWHKALLRDAVTALVAQWEPKLGVQVERVFLQRIKTRWGGCNHRAGNIRLNTELVKSPATCWSTSPSTRCCISSNRRTANDLLNSLTSISPRGEKPPPNSTPCRSPTKCGPVAHRHVADRSTTGGAPRNSR
jgi:hypothetical protein